MAHVVAKICLSDIRPPTCPCMHDCTYRSNSFGEQPHEQHTTVRTRFAVTLSDANNISCGYCTLEQTTHHRVLWKHEMCSLRCEESNENVPIRLGCGICGACRFEHPNTLPRKTVICWHSPRAIVLPCIASCTALHHMISDGMCLWNMNERIATPDGRDAWTFPRATIRIAMANHEKCIRNGIHVQEESFPVAIQRIAPVRTKYLGTTGPIFSHPCPSIGVNHGRKACAARHLRIAESSVFEPDL